MYTIIHIWTFLLSPQQSSNSCLSPDGFRSPIIAGDCRTGSLTALWQAAKLGRAKFLLGLRHVDQCRHPAVIMERKKEKDMERKQAVTIFTESSEKN